MDTPPSRSPSRRPDRPVSPLAALLDVLLPVACAGCGTPDEPLCRSCARPLRERSGAVAALAGTTAAGAPPTWATAEYTGAVRETVVAWKDHGRADLQRWLAPALAEAVQAAADQAPALRGQVPCPVPLTLVPVPSRSAATRQRGRDPVADLARATAVLLRRRGMPVLAVPALRPGRRLLDQSGLDSTARTGNLSGALRLARRLPAGAGVMLVDDVVTTGSTLAEAARVLGAAGVEVVAGAAVAATPRGV